MSMNIYGLSFVKVKNFLKSKDCFRVKCTKQFFKHFYFGKIMNGLKLALTWDITLWDF